MVGTENMLMDYAIKPEPKQHPVGRTCVLIGVFIVAMAIIYGCTSSTKESKPVNSNGRNEAWGFVGAGGGGAMFHPTVSPKDPEYAFVSCDMTGSFVTYNGGESWHRFNLRGFVNFYVFDPIDPNTVYANSIALFKSTDRGNTWSVLYPPPGEITGVVSKGDHAGETVVTSDSTYRKVYAFAVDPEDSKKLYAVITVDELSGFFISDNGGESWSKSTALEGEAKNIYIDPFTPKENRTIYIAGKNFIKVRKNNTWKTNSGPDGVDMFTEFAGGADRLKKRFIIYAISGKGYFNAKGCKSGIFYTENGGESWENRQGGLVAFQDGKNDFPEWRSIATSAQHPEVVYVSYANMKTANDTNCLGVAVSKDYGLTWELSWKDQITGNGNIPSANFRGGWLNERFGPTWGENPFSIGVSASNPDVAYATDFGRTVKTTNRGETWEQVYTQKKPGGGWISRGLEVNTGYAVVFDPFDTNHIFLANTDIGLMVSNDGGESWSSGTKNNGIPRNWQNSTYWLTFDPDVPGKAWAAMSGTHDLPRPKMWRRDGIARFTGGVVMTVDGGKSWSPVSADIGEAAITHILIDPTSNKESRTLYSCAFGKGVYKSTDGGINWQLKNRGLKNEEPFAWRIVRREDGVLFLIQSRRSDDGSIGTKGDGAIYRSDDHAESWNPIHLPSGTNGPTSLVIDPEDPACLLLSAWGRSTGGRFNPDMGGGIFLSKDEGETWKPVLQKDQHIHDITYDHRTKVYYACGFNSSAYRSTDRGETWERINGYNFKWGKRVDMDPRNPEKIFIVTFGGGVWYGPAFGDEQAFGDIISPEFGYRKE
ncbi:hypothetical protein D1164_10150 [Mariniphaga sediminis]|uniref:Sortilin N-terminal domain-containing protein n=2 Tax=Mariniphaga sediminis TaxID=1628158 RepID=A0A399D479_9BACT|nr:hypothetical protein D1164_10150 [Mariniphaga sediminis]